MARIARVVVPFYPHHIIHRGNRREKVFFNEDDKLVKGVCVTRIFLCVTHIDSWIKHICKEIIHSGRL